ncbi:MAG TPA: isochorismatase family protein [Spirochaetota bacterium]|nr:isochorismatase family protein [Spirochaetota bacterium]
MPPENFILEKEKTCLMVIDIQERLFNSMEYDIRKNVVRNIGILIETAGAFSMPVVVTEQYARGLGPTIPDIRNHLAGINAFDKTCFNCMLDGAIEERINSLGRKSVILCGIETHICVLTTALSLLAKGFRVVVASDAACSRRKHEWKMAISALRDAGAVIYPTETIAFMFIERSGTDEFKRLSPLFK